MSKVLICKETAKFKFKYVKDAPFHSKFKKGDTWYEKGLHEFMTDHLFANKITDCYKHFFLKINLILNKTSII